MKLASKFILVVWLTIVAAATSHAQLLTNGDFELPPILGAGQTGLTQGSAKGIATDPSDPNFAFAISGIGSWVFATPNQNGTSSDHGLAMRNASFGLDPSGQSAVINNWGRMMSQTISHTVMTKDRVTASINFGTLGDDTDSGRAGRFFLVAGEADLANPDVFSARSIILDEVSVANPTWTNFTPDVVVDNNQFIQLNLSYQYQLGDEALELPLTIGFLTAGGSVGPTYWDDATLSVTNSLVLLGDTNLDGVVDFSDIAPFIAVLQLGEFRAEADVDENGEVNFLDISPFIGVLSSR